MVNYEVEFGDYFVKLNVRNVVDGFCWGLLIVFGDAQPVGKPKFFVDLVHLLKNSRNPLLIGGDFNITRKASDKKTQGL